jgi:hypothetical protein
MKFPPLLPFKNLQTHYSSTITMPFVFKFLRAPLRAPCKNKRRPLLQKNLQAQLAVIVVVL